MRVRGYHPILPGFPSCSTSLHYNHVTVLQPRPCRNMAGLGSFPFARHYSGNHCYFLFLCLLRCFSSAGSLLLCHVFNMAGFPIRKSPDRVSFADPRRLSQLITSFIASESQGIPRVLFLTFFHSCAFCAARCAFLISISLWSTYCCLLFFFNFFQYVKELFLVFSS